MSSVAASAAKMVIPAVPRVVSSIVARSVVTAEYYSSRLLSLGTYLTPSKVCPDEQIVEAVPVHVTRAAQRFAGCVRWINPVESEDQDWPGRSIAGRDAKPKTPDLALTTIRFHRCCTRPASAPVGPDEQIVEAVPVQVPRVAHRLAAASHSRPSRRRS